MGRNGGCGPRLKAQVWRPCNYHPHRSRFSPPATTRAQTDRIDAELIARFMAFGPEVGRELPSENLRILRTLTTRRGQLVDMRKRLKTQIGARKKQGVSAGVETMDDDLQDVLDAQISVIERRIENVIAQTEPLAARANPLRSIPGIGPVSAAMLIDELPELDRMTSGEVAAITGLAPVPHDSGVMRGRRTIAGGRRPLRRVLFQAALATACHNPVLNTVAKRLKKAPKAAQAGDCRNRAKAGHNRQRDHQNRQALADSARRIDTVAKQKGNR